MTDGIAPVRRRRRPILAFGATVAMVMAVVTSTSGPAFADVDRVAGSATALTIGGLAPAPTVSGSAEEPTDSYGPIGSGVLQSGADCPSPGLIPGPLAIGVGLLEACTQGADVAGENHLGFSESSASAADVVLGTTELGVVSSECRADGDGARGSTTIIGSSGLPTNPTPGFVPPTLPLGVVALVLNEQVVTNTPGTATITVTAVRATLLGGIEVVIGQSTCEATGPNVNQVTTTTLPTGVTTTLPTGVTTTLPTGVTTTLPTGVTTTLPTGVTTTRPTGVTTTTRCPAVCPTATTTACPATCPTTATPTCPTGTATACPTTTLKVTGALVRTGSDNDLKMAWSAMALTLGALFLMGTKTMPGQTEPAPASGRQPQRPEGRRRDRREMAREIFREMRRFK